MKCDPRFATSPIFIDDKDYEFFVDPELITLVESDPFHGYETETYSHPFYSSWENSQLLYSQIISVLIKEWC